MGQSCPKKYIWFILSIALYPVSIKELAEFVQVMAHMLLI
jgi:hypothetical protein